MRNHPLGIYEKALAKDLSWPERLVLEFPSRLLGQVAAAFEGELKLETMGKNKIRAAVQAPLDGWLMSLLFTLGPELRLVSPKKELYPH